MAEIGSVLERLAADGCRESTGRFTVHEENARRKLASFRVADPRLLVLKLIQELVRLECTSIEIFRQSSNFTLFGAHPGADPSSMVDLALEVGGRCEDLGLWLVGPQRVDEIISSSLERPRLRGQGVLVGLKADWVGNLWDLVVDHCYFCPVPVCWHGNPVRSMAAKFPGGLARLWPRGPRLGESWTFPTQGQEGRLRVPLSGSCLPKSALRWNHYSDEILVQRVSCGEHRVAPAWSAATSQTCASALAIPLALRGPSWILMVKDGLTLDPIQLLEDFGCAVVMDGHDLSVDIAGLTARESSLLSERMALARSELAWLACECLERMEQLEDSPPSFWTKLRPGTRSRGNHVSVIGSLTSLAAQLAQGARPLSVGRWSGEPSV